MAVPTKEEFEAALQFDLFSCLTELIEGIDAEHTDNAAINAAVRSAWTDFQNVRKQFRLLPAVKWLVEQPPYQMAVKQLFSESSRMDAEWLSQTVIEEAEQKRARKDRVVKKASSAFIPIFDKWTLGLLGALHNYHYVDPAKCVAKSRDDARRFLKLAESFVPAIEAISYDPLVLGSGIFTDRLGQNDALSDHVIELKELVIRLSTAIETGCLYPSSRADQTLRERFFIHAMCTMHERLFAALRPDVISNLLYLDGIENRIENRNVEVHCNRFLKNLTNRYQVRLGEEG